MSTSKTAAAILALSADGDASAIEGVRRNCHIHIVASAENPDRMRQTSIAVNVLRRMFHRISIDGVDPANLELPPGLAATVGSGHALRQQASVVLVLSGERVRLPRARVIYADNRGWTAFVSKVGPWDVDRPEMNGLGAIYAGALGAAECFNWAFRQLIPGVQHLQGTQTYDLIAARAPGEPNYSPSIENGPPLDIDVLVVGAGAVGQAFLYALGVLPDVRGRVEIVDHELLDETNEERYIWAFPANRNQLKAEVMKAYVASKFPLLEVRANVPMPSRAHWHRDFGTIQVVGPSAAVPGGPVGAIIAGPGWAKTDYQEWRQYDGGSPRSLVVCAVDSAKARRDIQFGLHRVILNGWTETGASLMSFGAGRHTIGDRACMACQYHKTEKEPPDPLEFYHRITGLDMARLRTLLEVSGENPSRSELEAIAKRRNIAPEQLLGEEGKPLRAVLQRVCGVATLKDQDREGTSPAAHVPVLVGVHLVTKAVLEALGRSNDTPPLVSGDTRTVPRGAFAVPTTPPVEGCLCKDKRVSAHYDKLWRV